jgi:hypothetical protein
MLRISDVFENDEKNRTHVRKCASSDIFNINIFKESEKLVIHFKILGYL